MVDRKRQGATCGGGALPCRKPSATGSVNGLSSAAEWEAFVDDLQQTLDKFAVPQPEQAELKAIVASTRADIVV